MELLEFDAELLADEAELDELKPIIDYHLALCSPYKEQLEDWLEKLAMPTHGSSINATFDGKTRTLSGVNTMLYTLWPH